MNPVMPFSPLDALLDCLPELRKAGRVKPGDTVLRVQHRMADVLRPIVLRIEAEERKRVLEEFPTCDSCGLRVKTSWDAHEEDCPGRLQDLLVDVAQILDGWHQDGTAWSEWDESVRKRISMWLNVLVPQIKEE